MANEVGYVFDEKTHAGIIQMYNEWRADPGEIPTRKGIKEPIPPRSRKWFINTDTTDVPDGGWIRITGARIVNDQIYYEAKRPNKINLNDVVCNNSGSVVKPDETGTFTTDLCEGLYDTGDTPAYGRAYRTMANSYELGDGMGSFVCQSVANTETNKAFFAKNRIPTALLGNNGTVSSGATSTISTWSNSGGIALTATDSSTKLQLHESGWYRFLYSCTVTGTPSALSERFTVSIETDGGSLVTSGSQCSGSLIKGTGAIYQVVTVQDYIDIDADEKVWIEFINQGSVSMSVQDGCLAITRVKSKFLDY